MCPASWSWMNGANDCSQILLLLGLQCVLGCHCDRSCKWFLSPEECGSKVVLRRKWRQGSYKPLSKPGWSLWLNEFGAHLNRRFPSVLLPTPKNSAVFQALPRRWRLPHLVTLFAADLQPRQVHLARLWIKSSFEIFYNLVVHSKGKLNLRTQICTEF